MVAMWGRCDLPVVAVQEVSKSKHGSNVVLDSKLGLEYNVLSMGQV